MYIVKYSDTINPFDYMEEFETEREACEWIEREMSIWEDVLYKEFPDADVVWINRYLDCGNKTEIYIPDTSIEICCELIGGYVKPTEEQIEYAINEGWSREAAERGYDIFDFDGLGLLNIEAIGDVYLGVGNSDGYDDDACAHEAERSGFCKIIPIEELPDPFIIDGIDRRYFGWVDTPENRKAIANFVCNN